MPLKKSILIAGCIALFLAATLAVILLLPEQTDSPAETTPQNLQYFFDLNHTEHLDAIAFTYRDHPSISLERVGDDWQVKSRAGLPIDSAALALLLQPLEQMLALRVITEDCKQIEEYGLDQPILTLTLSEGDSSKTYLFGNFNSHYKGYYCMIKGTKAVYLLSESYLLPYDTTLTELLRTEHFPSIDLPALISMTDSIGAEVTLSPEDRSNLERIFTTLSIDRMVDYGQDKYAAYRLDSPTVFTLSRANGRPLTLSFAGGETDELVYLRMDDTEIIYLVKCEEMATLLGYLR